jgi:hypothetical protein
VDDFEEINFMTLIRTANSITQMSEEEVLGLLESLGNSEFQEQLGEDDLVEIIAAIAMSRMGELNGPGALDMIFNAGEDSVLGDREIASMCIVSWVEADPQGAIAWIENVRGGGGEEFMREMVGDPDFHSLVVGALARADREAAFKYVDEAEGDARAASLATLARHEASSAGIRQLLESTGASEVDARREVLDTWAERDPKAAVEWVDAQPKGEEHAAYVEVVAKEYVQADPAAGAEWYMSQEIPESREAERYNQIVRNWAWRDYDAASNWLREQVDGPSREAAEANMAGVAADQRRWEGAFSWAGEIDDAGQQNQVVDRIFERSFTRNKEPMVGFEEAARAAGYGERLDALLLEKQGGK